MKKPLSVLACALLFFSSCSCPKNFGPSPSDIACINIIDRNGFSETFSNNERLKQYANVNFYTPQPYQKVLRVYGKDKNGETKAVITSYHENGQIKQYLDVVNNRASGTYKEWFANGSLKMEANVIGGMADLTITAERSWLFESTNTVWDEQGNMEAEITYSKGELQGDSTYYYPNKAVWKAVPFEKNEIHGTFKVYFDNGDLLSTSEYDKGLKSGQSIRYWPDQTVASLEWFSKGLLCTGEYYDCDGQLISEIKQGCGYKVIFGKNTTSELHEYKNGIPEGEVQLFTPNGMLNTTFHVKNGLKHGEEVEYYDPLLTGKEHSPKISLNWFEGKLQGTVRTWYTNGTQESQRELSQNKKNGLSTAWYRDGNLMMIEEYDTNKLVKGQYYKLGERIPASKVAMGAGVATLYDSEGNFSKKVEYRNGEPDE